jgi:hypothetical protein
MWFCSINIIMKYKLFMRILCPLKGMLLHHCWCPTSGDWTWQKKGTWNVRMVCVGWASFTIALLAPPFKHQVDHMSSPPSHQALVVASLDGQCFTFSLSNPQLSKFKKRRFLALPLTSLRDRDSRHHFTFLIQQLNKQATRFVIRIKGRILLGNPKAIQRNYLNGQFRPQSQAITQPDICIRDK